MININRIILRRKINHLLKDIKYSPFFFVCNYLPPFTIIVFSGKFITTTTRLTQFVPTRPSTMVLLNVHVHFTTIQCLPAWKDSSISRHAPKLSLVRSFSLSVSSRLLPISATAPWTWPTTSSYVKTVNQCRWSARARGPLTASEPSVSWVELRRSHRSAFN